MTKFTLEEIKSHGKGSERPWVTRGRDVYDITDWVGAHPGGEIILNAAGGSVDPYWDIFAIHKKQDVYEILEQFKIGEVDEADLVDGLPPSDEIRDPFEFDPVRDPRLRVLTSKPCNAESPREALKGFITPNEVFYVRNHMWVPEVGKDEHQLTIELPNGEERTYSVQELKDKFRHYKVTATMQCAGNRRSDMTKYAKKTNGLQWEVGAISTAEWEGVRLRDVLADAGVNVNEPNNDMKHTHFVGMEAYAASIPIEKAIDPYGDVLLAFKMNGEVLPRDHGYPLRTVVPGTVAARSVKWLQKIVVSDEESTSQWQRRDYKCFGPNVGSNPDWSKAKSIQEMPVTSAITSLSHSYGEKGERGVVEGYAYSGGGHEIVRVDVSLDGGATWDQAELMQDEQKGHRNWSWKKWRYSYAIDNVNRQRDKTVLVKATDDAYNTQPKEHDSIYNARGNLATAWHRVERD